MLIETPGQAMELVMKALRVEQFNVDQVESVRDTEDGTPTEYFNVTGELVRQEDLIGVGRFTALVAEDGTYKIKGGAFGLIDSESEEADPFYML